MKDGRWVTVVDWQFTHDKQGIDAIKEPVLDAPPFRMWAISEFRDNRGRLTGSVAVIGRSNCQTVTIS